MTGHWCDFQNADFFLTCGSNNAENHPESARWVQFARDKGAVNICVDPRFTRTAAVADYYCPIRPGTDIAFYGGLISYAIENDLYQKEYVKAYTNASYLIDPNYNFDIETGLFSGWNEKTKTYDTTSWGYQTEEVVPPNTEPGGAFSYTLKEGVPQFTPPSLNKPKRDMTLQDPQCCFQIMKKHYSRYTIEQVAAICGMGEEALETVYKLYCSSGAPEKVGAILYALGQTQHHYGSQNTRIMGMVQLLLGNIGVPGGSVNALRGEPNVQGATDMCILTYDFPGYLKWPNAAKHYTLSKYCEKEAMSDGYYVNKPKFLISGLKEWYGENATYDNDYCYDLLPKVPAEDNFTSMRTFQHMEDGTMKGYFAWGMNPCHSTANTSYVRRAMGNLEWLVAVDQVITETASFWNAPDINPAEVKTECYFWPCALIYEKPGTILNSGRWIQWRYKAVEPVGEAKPDLEIIDMFFTKVQEMYKKEGGAVPEAITKVKWDYYKDGKVDARCVAMALNGYKVMDGAHDWENCELINSFGQLEADGSTSTAMWIYAGFYANGEHRWDPSKQNVGRRVRDDKSGLGLYPEWAFAWPANRRILYNRASADLAGKPWNKDRALVEWTGSEWITNDVPDFTTSTKDAEGNTVPVEPNDKAFIMTWEGQSRFICSTMADMPIPEHYEPFESPTSNALNGAEYSPCIQFADHHSVKRGSKEDYPLAITTYSVTEMWQTGGQTRACPALNEVRPEQFIEISKDLAAERGIKNGEMVRMYNNRGDIEVMALVTDRLKPMQVNGEKTHVIGAIHHWSWAGVFATGPTVNDLPPNVGDPNSFIPEYKAFLVNIEKI